MKQDQIWFAVISLVLVFSARVSQAASDILPLERVEVPVAHVFVPPQGYDDNDNIQLVLDGTLPNACYKVADNSIRLNKETQEIRAQLYADRKIDGDCADPRQIPPSLQAPVPFTVEVSVGKLSWGQYQVVYKDSATNQRSRTFVVEKAQKRDVDNVPYAAISSVWINDTVPSGSAIEATIVGSLTSTCAYLTPEVVIKKMDDIFVVLQGQSVRPNLICAFMLVPFQRTLQLGTADEGRYLIHARSMNGNAVNHAFSVVMAKTK